MDKKDTENIIPISNLHTLESDLLSAVKNESYSSNIVKILDNTKNKVNSNTTDGDRKTKKFILYSVLILLTISLVVFALYILAKKGGVTVDQDPLPNTKDNKTSTSSEPIVYNQNILKADLVLNESFKKMTKQNFINKINSVENKLKENNIGFKVNAVFQTDISITDLFNTIRYTGPDSLVRSFLNEKDYSFGLYHNKNGIFEKYLIVKIDLFDNAFSGMLEWENSIPVDLEKIFIYSTKSSTTSSSTISISTSTESNPNVQLIPLIKNNTDLEKKFIDKVIKNIDTRIYTDTEKKVKILYSIVNKEYLIITSGEESFVDIINKLTINSILR